jgi:hypothetical protein
MARTDKDRPWWVVQHQENNPIKHDHRHGECVEETFETSRGYAHNRHRYGHCKNCRKYTTIEYTCTKAEPYRGRYGYGTQTCWVRVCTCPIPDSWKSELHGCENREWTGCIGHTRRDFDASIPCVCDDFPPDPTCCRSYTYDYPWTRGGAPSSYVHVVWTGPERARERDGLRALAKEFNATGGIEDDDFPNNQHRHGAAWMWW